MTKVVHCKRERYDVYIGRGPGCIWGNPFSHKDGTLAKHKVDTREEAVEKYREYILNKPELLECLEELKGKVLGCWCAGKVPLTENDKPFRCHGQVILELIEIGDNIMMTKDERDSIREAFIKNLASWKGEYTWVDLKVFSNNKYIGEADFEIIVEELRNDSRIFLIQ